MTRTFQSEQEKLQPAILLIAYRRPIHFSHVVESIQGSSNPVYVWLNGPVDSNDEQASQKCINIVEDSNLNVKSILHNGTNFTPGESIIGALDWAFSQNKSVIVLEDDIVVGKHFLPFMEYCLERFETDMTIGSIGGLHWDRTNRPKAEWRLTHFMNPWGWATWSDRWVKFVREMSDWRLSGEFVWPRAFERFPTRRHYTRVFDELEKGLVDHWDYRFLYSQLRNGQLTLQSNRNLIRNIGFDQQATHTFQRPRNLRNQFDAINMLALQNSNPKLEHHSEVKFSKYCLDQTWNELIYGTLRRRLQEIPSRIRNRS